MPVNGPDFQTETLPYAVPPGEAYAQTFFMTHEGVEMASLFPRLSARQRRQMLELARTFVEECPSPGH